MIPAVGIIENNLWQILCVVLEFLSNGEGLDYFLQHNSHKLSEITVTCPKQYKGTNRVNSDLPKFSKININFELLKVGKIMSLKIYISSVMEKLETSNFDSR